MRGADNQSAWLGDARLAAHALSPTPVWLWRMDATRILWANPTGAAIFNAASPGAISAQTFNAQQAAAAQVARLAGTLPAGGTQRLERLRGFGARFGGTLMCMCSRFALQDGGFGVLIVSIERAGTDLSLAERAARMLSDFTTPAAIFAAGGELIDATASARARLGEHRDLVALGAEKLARTASADGKAEGTIAAGPLTLLKLGAGNTVALLALFDADTITAARAPDQASPTPHARQTLFRQVPFRFVWQMDAALRFTLGSDDVVRLLGAKTAGTLNRPWNEVAAMLKIDADGHIASALASRDTWSGIVVEWPVDDMAERLPVEMSGLPVYDGSRQFTGYRGFGVCRDLDRLAAIERKRAEATIEPVASNIVAFPATQPSLAMPSSAAPALNAGERIAFQELARELSARLKNPVKAAEVAESPPPAPEPPKAARNGRAESDANAGRPILDRMPVGVLVYRLNNLIYANRAFLDWTGYEDLDALREAGGLDSLFIETRDSPAAGGPKSGGKTLTIAAVNGKQKPVEGKLFPVAWNNESALALMITTQPPASDETLRKAEQESAELRSILDTATDGVLVVDRQGRVLSANRSAEALFGYDAKELVALGLGDLFAPESRRALLDYLDRIAAGATAGILETGRDGIGRVKRGGLVPLFVTLGRIENSEKICAVLRDVTAWKRSEEDLINARQAAERGSMAKSEFLAKISHEIRTPLNAIIGFSEVMMEERFGPVANERYTQYLKDIHDSGGHLISLLNDLLDLSKIEAGKLDLTFVSVNLNDLVQQCVAIMQQQANRERVIIRTSLPTNLPQIVADTRSVRQIVLNLLSNSIKFTGAGGQVIVSTALTDDHEVALRVRDTGTGMSEKDLQTALEPFRQLATAARWGASGTGLGLPITKALTEANHARFRISSKVAGGTLVEVAFPATRVLA